MNWRVSRRSKYGARKTEVDGITFDSRAEARRYGELKMLEQSAIIKDLELQPRYPLYVNGIKVCTYVADFHYYDCEKGQWVIEDKKGFKTPVYKLKLKFFRALYPNLLFLES